MKGYMIFVEGGESPKVVHSSFTAAFGVMRFMARRHPDKEVLLMQLRKRVVADSNGKITKLPSHLPKNSDKRNTTLKDLVTKAEAADGCAQP